VGTLSACEEGAHKYLFLVYHLSSPARSCLPREKGAALSACTTTLPHAQRTRQHLEPLRLLHCHSSRLKAPVSSLRCSRNAAATLPCVIHGYRWYLTLSPSAHIPVHTSRVRSGGPHLYMACEIHMRSFTCSPVLLGFSMLPLTPRIIWRCSDDVWENLRMVDDTSKRKLYCATCISERKADKIPATVHCSWWLSNREGLLEVLSAPAEGTQHCISISAPVLLYLRLRTARLLRLHISSAAVLVSPS